MLACAHEPSIEALEMRTLKLPNRHTESHQAHAIYVSKFLNHVIKCAVSRTLLHVSEDARRALSVQRIEVAIVLIRRFGPGSSNRLVDKDVVCVLLGLKCLGWSAKIPTTHFTRCDSASHHGRRLPMSRILVFGIFLGICHYLSRQMFTQSLSGCFSSFFIKIFL